MAKDAESDKLLKILILILDLILWGFIGWNIFKATRIVPKIEIEPETSIEKCFVKAELPPVMIEPKVYGILIEDKTSNITLEEAKLLDCMWLLESQRGEDMFGDYRQGKAMAYGHYQIWVSKHQISYECAMDFECSKDYTISQIRQGNGNLWTSYKKCVNR